MTWQYYEFMFSKDSGSRPEPLPDYYKGDYRYKLDQDQLLIWNLKHIEKQY